MISRVPQQMMTRRFQNNMNQALKQMSDINQKILTGRKFMRGSEDPVRAAKALVIRRSLSNIEMYNENLKDAQGLFETASALIVSNISPRMATISDKLLAATNGSMGQTERDIIAEEIESVGRDLLKDMNADFAGRKIYGGSNNSVPPFTYDGGTGKVSYNGVPVDTQVEANLTDPDNPVYTFNGEIVNLTEKQEVAFKAGTLDNSGFFPGSKPAYADIGIGIQYDANGAVDPTTAFDMAINGAKITGSGVSSKTGYANNAIQLAFDAAKALRAGDLATASDLVVSVKDSQTTIVIGVTNLGVKTSTIEYNQLRMGQDEITYATAQVNAEGLTLEEQAELMTQYKSVEAAYNATLQMGSKVVPTSVFDFIR